MYSWKAFLINNLQSFLLELGTGYTFVARQKRFTFNEEHYEKQEDENPTIGVLLCQDKDDSLVELTLPKDSNIYASKYQLYLPDKKVLRDKLREWTEETGGAC